MIDRDDARVLLSLARGSIAERLGGARVTVPDLPLLRADGPCFVTLHRRGELHGCIGSFEGRALGDAVRRNACAAAFEDPRAVPLELADVDELEVEISLLSPRTPLSFDGEADARAQLRPGIDGLVLEWARHRGVFLPQVWESLPEPRVFLDHLKRKAGLPEHFWAPDVALERFTVQKFVDPPHTHAPASRQG
jgi:AmmeMemoRadiSam system protein A